MDAPPSPDKSAVAAVSGVDAPIRGDDDDREGSAESEESEEARSLRERLLIAQLERELSKITETERELWYYNVMGRGMFVIVHIVLLLALYVAWVEFRNARGSREQAHAADQQEVKLSLEGIALKSSRQGTILLGLAFGFYLLYVKFVYPLVVL